MINKFILILFFIITTACNFEPIFSQKNQKIYNFTISKVDISGETAINTIFRRALENYTKEKSKNNYEIVINSEIIKEVISRDTKGDAASYKLTLLTSVFVSNYQKEKTTSKYKETFEYMDNDDSFELRQYEYTIKRNLAENTINEIILNIARIKDNAN
jgi:outer membrane lipopolysaccharide assembly protein LptE/RlpB